MMRSWQVVVVAGTLFIGGVVSAQGKSPEAKKGPEAAKPAETKKADGKGPEGAKGPEGKGPAGKGPEGKGPEGKPVDPKAAAAEMAAMFPKPGPETKALQPFIGMLKLKGTMTAGAMGPDSPAVDTKGTHSCKWTMGGLWVDCDVKDGPAVGKAPAWMGHVHVGWDYMVKMYRAVLVDNMGGAMMMEGKMDGAKLVMESVGTYQMMGKPMKSRMTFDLTDPKAIKIAEERQMDGKWVVVHESTASKGGGAAPKPAAQ